MRSSDRLFFGMLAGVVVLIVAGLIALFAVGGRQSTEFPEDSAQGVVQRYLRALDEGDGNRAYEYLADSAKNQSPGPKQNYQRSSSNSTSGRSRRILLESAEVTDNDARIIVSVSTVASSGPTSTNENTQRIDFRLKREAGLWKIVSPAYPPYLGFALPTRGLAPLLDHLSVGSAI